MYPVLYSFDEQTYATNGIGMLSDCISCKVTEERNGIFEVEMEYPITGIHYDDIENGRIISITHDDNGDKQPFIIYRISKPISGVVVVNAYHISYKLCDIVVTPFSATTMSEAMSYLKSNSVNVNPFSFYSDNTTVATFSWDIPSTIRGMMGGVEGSLLDVYGGEWEFDNFTVKNLASRGSNNGVTIRYGKNLTDLTYEINEESLYSAVVPYWTNGESSVYGGVVQGHGQTDNTAAWTDENSEVIKDENGTDIEFRPLCLKVKALDLSSYFEEEPTADELEAMAATYLANNTPWIPKENIEVSFAALWQTDEYADIAPLEEVKLCDTVTIIYTDLGVEATAKVITVVWDALRDRYESIELGDAKTSFADTIKNATITEIGQIFPTTTKVEGAIAKATALITGGMGGYIVYHYDDDGYPTEMLVMDTNDEETATYVLRINVNGIGFSSTGVDGTYTSAWTLDGNFVADFITAGKISDASGDNYWDLDSGEISFTSGYLADWTVYLTYLMTGDLTTPGNEGARLTTGGITFNSVGTSYSTLRYINFGVDTCYIADNSASSYTQYASQGMYHDGSNPYIDYYIDSSQIMRLAYSAITMNKAVTCNSSLTVSGTKSRAVDTEDYGTRKLYCYEMASPVFGDVGEGKIGEDGYCYVMIDSVLAETIATSQYQVFLQKYGEGDCYVKERTGAYFIVAGTPGLAFGWELKAKQADYDQIRLEKDYEAEIIDNDFGQAALNHITQIYEERTRV